MHKSINYDSSKLKRNWVAIGLKNERSWLSFISIWDFYSTLEIFDLFSLSSFLDGDFDGFFDYLSADFLDFASSPFYFFALGGLSEALSLDLDLAFFSLIYLSKNNLNAKL